jgi:formamidopyrimidine-DNA glycosylase
MIAKLGPEPLDPAFDALALAGRLKGRKTPIKAALLDQSVVAGLGNIYVSECLFHAGISPRRSAHTVQGGRCEKLIVAIRDVLNAAIAAGGSSLRDHRQTSGELGYFQHQFAVYDKAGQPCPGCDCQGGMIQQIVQSGRSTYFCLRRQT